jgi:hypothetical protein
MDASGDDKSLEVSFYWLNFEILITFVQPITLEEWKALAERQQKQMEELKAKSTMKLYGVSQTRAPTLPAFCHHWGHEDQATLDLELASQLTSFNTFTDNSSKFSFIVLFD